MGGAGVGRTVRGGRLRYRLAVDHWSPISYHSIVWDNERGGVTTRLLELKGYSISLLLENDGLRVIKVLPPTTSGSPVTIEGIS